MGTEAKAAPGDVERGGRLVEESEEEPKVDAIWAGAVYICGRVEEGSIWPPSQRPPDHRAQIGPSRAVAGHLSALLSSHPRWGLFPALGPHAPPSHRWLLHAPRAHLARADLWLSRTSIHTPPRAACRLPGAVRPRAVLGPLRARGRTRPEHKTAARNRCGDRQTDRSHSIAPRPPPFPGPKEAKSPIPAPPVRLIGQSRDHVATAPPSCGRRRALCGSKHFAGGQRQLSHTFKRPSLAGSKKLAQPNFHRSLT